MNSDRYDEEADRFFQYIGFYEQAQSSAHDDQWYSFASNNLVGAAFS